ncbi:AAA domain protein [Mycobacterium xenopi 4042]|uniref:AAA domain protein n=1 Tax=Mycobacterium xenopi 4042 TaxID=1299334 RepID=X8DKW3_MYCXE|nr:AAA domain protein [Mycobacterium xenopi 4042]
MPSIYIAAPEGDTGKSTIALGILHRLTATAPKVGVFRPITRLGEDRDYILELLLAHASAGLPYERCVGVTYQQLHADRDAAIADIVERYHGVADQCDAVVIVGSDYTDVTSPAELSVNARIAVNLGAPVLLVVRAKGRSADDVAHVVEVSRAELAEQRAHLVAVVANRCEPAQLSVFQERLTKSLAGLTPRTYVLPDEPVLVAPTVADLQRVVNGRLLSGDPALMGREVMGVVVAGMIAEHVLERLSEGAAVITRVTAPTLCWRSPAPMPPTAFRHCRASSSTAGLSCIPRSRRWWPDFGCACR